jgi:hypothetical protein
MLCEGILYKILLPQEVRSLSCSLALSHLFVRSPSLYLSHTSMMKVKRAEQTCTI